MTDRNDSLDMIQTAADEFLRHELVAEVLRPALDDISDLASSFWAKCVGLGWPATLIDPPFGGLGLDMRHAAAIAMAMGRYLAPGPFIPSSILCSWAIQEAGDQDLAAQLLPELANGTMRGAVALSGQGARRSEALIGVVAEPVSAGWRINGTSHGCLEPLGSDVVVVAAQTPQGIGMFVVTDAHERCDIHKDNTVDPTRRIGTIFFDALSVDKRAQLVGGSSLRDRVLDRGAIAATADAVGAAQRALELSITYAKLRNQFGRPIGSFQAIKHKLVDMFLSLQAARSSLESAVAELDQPNVASRRIAAAAMSARDAASKITGDAIQVHGGIGYTWEHNCHLLFRRAHLDAELFGSTGWYADHLVDCVVDEVGASS